MTYRPKKAGITQAAYDAIQEAGRAMPIADVVDEVSRRLAGSGLACAEEPLDEDRLATMLKRNQSFLRKWSEPAKDGQTTDDDLIPLWTIRKDEGSVPMDEVRALIAEFRDARRSLVRTFTAISASMFAITVTIAAIVIYHSTP